MSIYLDVDTREEYRELLRWVCRQESSQENVRCIEALYIYSHPPYVIYSNQRCL